MCDPELAAWPPEPGFSSGKMRILPISYRLLRTQYHITIIIVVALNLSQPHHWAEPCPLGFQGLYRCPSGLAVHTERQGA